MSLLSSGVSSVIAQDTLSGDPYKNENPVQKVLKRDTITVVDSLITTQFVNEKEQTLLLTTSKDSIQFRLSFLVWELTFIYTIVYF